MKLCASLADNIADFLPSSLMYSSLASPPWRRMMVWQHPEKMLAARSNSRFSQSILFGSLIIAIIFQNFVILKIRKVLYRSDFGREHILQQLILVDATKTLDACILHRYKKLRRMWAFSRIVPSSDSRLAAINAAFALYHFILHRISFC